MRDSQSLHQPWIQSPSSSGLFKLYMQRIRREDHEGFAICRWSDENIVGLINVNHIVRGTFQSASLGYYVGASYEGQGYMGQGLLQLIGFAFSTLGLHRLEANIQPENTRSRTLVENCGFTFEGLSKAFLYINGSWRDHERWCIVDARRSLKP
jgi:ribosomal-protein-alanine N-acetyltransferase